MICCWGCGCGCCGRISLVTCCGCCGCNEMGVEVRSVTGGGPLAWIWAIRLCGIGCVGSCTIRVGTCWSSCCCTGVTLASRDGTLMPEGRLDCGTGSSDCKLGGNIVVVVVVWTRGSGVCCIRDIWTALEVWGRGFKFDGGPGSWENVVVVVCCWGCCCWMITLAAAGRAGVGGA